MNFLIADDNQTDRKLLRAQLEGEGHSVLDVADGIAALQVLEREPVDVIISDILMPNMDGFRLCQEIRKNKKLCALPIVVFTATYNSIGDKELAENMGADCYLIKPASTSIIMATIQEAMQKAAARTLPALVKSDEDYVLRQYNGALVKKLEVRNVELQIAVAKVEMSRDEIAALNRNLEAHVKERTAALDFANEELEAFTASVSHDLRAPLRHLCGYAHLLEESVDERLSEESKTLLRRIHEAARRMDQLIVDLLAFAHASRGDLHMSDVNLETLVEETINTLRVDCQERNVEWQRGPLPIVQGDKALLRQVFINLISNAVKYTRPCDPARIEIGCRDENTKEPIFFVRDNGIGFDMQYTSQLFSVFGRLHNDSRFEGTGIGLANVRRIITRHGGRIWAEAELGHGATFYFTLCKAANNLARRSTDYRSEDGIPRRLAGAASPVM